MSAVRASAPLTFIRPTPPLWGISAGYITIKELRPQIKKDDDGFAFEKALYSIPKSEGINS
jgi:hypothetical protein